jgi:hypothetical protein
VTIGLGTDLDDPGALQLPQPLGEQPAREARGTVGDLVEGLTADQDVAKMMIVQRSARSSDVRAMGQYCP